MEVYTTGYISKLLSVAPRTVSKWCDSGKLESYRLPGSLDRRIPRESLIRFLNAHGMARFLPSLQRMALLVGLRPEEVEIMRWGLEDRGYTIHEVADVFGVGSTMAQGFESVPLIVLSCSINRASAAALIPYLRKDPRVGQVVYLAAEDDGDLLDTADLTLQLPLSPVLTQQIYSLLGQQKEGLSRREDARSDQTHELRRAGSLLPGAGQ